MKSRLFCDTLRGNADRKCATSLARKINDEEIETGLQVSGFAVVPVDVTSSARLDKARRKVIVERISIENDRLLQDKDGGTYDTALRMY
jgi:hypothetical protein